MSDACKGAPLRVFEGFAGYGGASFGLKRLKENIPDLVYEVVGYSEVDKFASALFDANHRGADGGPLKNSGDITKIDPCELPDFDMFMGGFPCQPFSSGGMQMGTEDPYGRGAMPGHIVRICRVKRPRYLFQENVKGFTHGKFQPIHDQQVKDLWEMGYGEPPLAKAVLNSKDYGIPQNRERLWMFARLGGLPEGFSLVPGKVDSDVRIGDQGEAPHPVVRRRRAPVLRCLQQEDKARRLLHNHHAAGAQQPPRCGSPQGGRAGDSQYDVRPRAVPPHGLPHIQRLERVRD